jgi:uncharacterized membrane protein YoaK (UPF0700 family)
MARGRGIARIHLATTENTAFQAGVLSMVAGYADTLGYLSFGAFAGLMTGNTVLLGIALAQREPLHALRNLAIILAFLSGVAISALLRRIGCKLPLLFALEALALLAAAFLTAVIAAPSLAFGMGMQNAAATRFAGASANTVFLTGDLQKLIQAAVGWLVDRRSNDAGAGVLALIYACYLSGVLLGAASYLLIEHPLLLAILPLPLALLPLEIRRRSGTAADRRGSG